MKSTILTLVAILVGVPAFAQKVNVDFAEDADFSQYQTYQYKKSEVPVPSQLMDQRVVAAIEYHLSMKGYEQVDANPDLLVTYHASAHNEQRITTDYYGGGYGRYRGGWSSGTTRTHTYTKGTLVVDIWDAKEKALLWRGTATDTVSDKPEKNEKKVNKSCEKMFDKFPPEQK